MTLAPRIPLPQVDRRGGRQPFSTCGEGEDAHENEGQRWREPRSAIHHDREKGSLSRGLQRDLSLSLALLLCFGGRTVNGATPARVSRFVISFISTKERRRSCASGVSASAAGEEKRLRSLLWRAPELLRLPSPPSHGTQKGDVYSFAIILFEIIGRRGPWGDETDLSIEGIIDRVAHPHSYGGRIFRPNLKQVDYKNCGHYVIKCIDDCWHEDPDFRPDFRFINIRLKEMQSGLSVSLFACRRPRYSASGLLLLLPSS